MIPPGRFTQREVGDLKRTRVELASEAGGGDATDGRLWGKMCLFGFRHLIWATPAGEVPGPGLRDQRLTMAGLAMPIRGPLQELTCPHSDLGGLSPRFYSLTLQMAFGDYGNLP